MTDIQDWLERLGLGKYGAVFAEQEITLDILPDLTEPDIDGLDLPTGPRRRLMVEIEALRAARVQSPAHSSETAARSPRRPLPRRSFSRRRAASAHRDVLRPGGFHRAGADASTPKS